jgi:hypothetical protein
MIAGLLLESFLGRLSERLAYKPAAWQALFA